MDIPDAPAWLVPALQQGQRRTRKRGGPLREGERNDQLFKAACAMRREGLVYEEILAALQKINESRCKPHLDNHEVDQIAESAARYPAEQKARDPISPESDIANVRRFVDQHKERCRWHKDRRRFVRYDEGRWAPGGIYDLWTETVRSIYAEAANEEDPDRRKALGAWARQCENNRRFQAVTGALRDFPGLTVSQSAFDAAPYVVNAKNVVLDLSGGELKVRPHAPADFCMRQLGTDYEEGALCPTFVSALERSLPDFQVRRALQILLGKSLLGLSLPYLPILIGRGDNGKTTFCEAVEGVLGDYAKTCDPSTLHASRREGNTASPDIARLAGTRFVMVNDPKQGHRLAEELVKNLTGNDTVSARFMYGEVFEFVFRGTIMMRTNFLPKFDGSDFAMAKRVLVIPFGVQIPKAEQDADLPQKLKAEAPGILNWLLEGALDYINEGFKLPDAVEKATKAYIVREDPVGRFVDERLELEADARATNAELWEAWASWLKASEGVEPAKASRGVPKTIRALGDQLIRRYTQVRRYQARKDRGLEGVALTGE